MYPLRPRVKSNGPLTTDQVTTWLERNEFESRLFLICVNLRFHVLVCIANRGCYFESLHLSPLVIASVQFALFNLELFCFAGLRLPLITTPHHSEDSCSSSYLGLEHSHSYQALIKAPNHWFSDHCYFTASQFASGAQYSKVKLLAWRLDSEIQGRSNSFEKHSICSIRSSSHALNSRKICNFTAICGFICVQYNSL